MYLLFAVYLSGVYAAAGLPSLFSLTFRPRLNVRLFAYMFSDYRSSLLNVVFFVPLGFLLPMLWQRFRRFHRTFFFALGLSLVIEILQLLTPRATDVNDLVTNSAGAVLGYGFSMLLQRIFPGLRSQDDSREVYFIGLIVGAVMFFLYPLFF